MIDNMGAVHGQRGGSACCFCGLKAVDLTSYSQPFLHVLYHFFSPRSSAGPYFDGRLGFLHNSDREMLAASLVTLIQLIRVTINRVACSPADLCDWTVDCGISPDRQFSQTKPTSPPLRCISSGLWFLMSALHCPWFPGAGMARLRP